jgi:transcription antitermination factor NusG
VSAIISLFNLQSPRPQKGRPISGSVFSCKDLDQVLCFGNSSTKHPRNNEEQSSLSSGIEKQLPYDFLQTVNRKGIMDQGPWHVLHVTANHEKKVTQHLTTRSVEHYLPLYAERSRWTDRTVIVQRPLFTGYVFVRFSLQSRLSVISAPGVIRLIGDGRSDMVDGGEIERIRDGLARGCLIRPHPNVSVGTPVRVRHGVFEGVEGIVSDLRDRCKVIIALSAVRQSFSLELNLEEMEVLASPASATELPNRWRLDAAHI